MMSDQIFTRPNHLVGSVVDPGMGRAPQNLTYARAPQRPVTDEATNETMRVSANTPYIFEGPVPKLGDTVEFVCVRCDNRGWGLKLRVKENTDGQG